MIIFYTTFQCQGSINNLPKRWTLWPNKSKYFSIFKSDLRDGKQTKHYSAILLKVSYRRERKQGSEREREGGGMGREEGGGMGTEEGGV